MNRRKGSALEIKRRVGSILKKEISDRVWQYAVDDFMVSEVEQGENTVAWLAQKLQRLMELEEQGAIAAAPTFIKPTRKHRRGKMTTGRREAVSEALAAIARQNIDVISFRREILNGTLLKVNALDRWVKDHQSEETYPHAILVRLRHGFKLDYTDGWTLEPPLSSMGPEVIEGLATVNMLEYAMPDSRWVRRMPIGRDGTLRKTYELAVDLTRRFSWQQAQATVFLLTDLTPLVETENIEIRYPVTLPYVGQSPLMCLLRVVITVDPSITPRELAQKYAQIRAKLLKRKWRLQTEKHVQLALFAVNDRHLNSEAMREWNKDFPNWRYTRLSQFTRDAKTARNRLLHEPIAELGDFPFSHQRARAV
jgi:hypothetical protein